MALPMQERLDYLERANTAMQQYMDDYLRKLEEEASRRDGVLEGTRLAAPGQD